MSDTLINIRVFSWHFMLRKGSWKPLLVYNGHHKASRWMDGRVKVYEFFGLPKKP